MLSTLSHFPYFPIDDFDFEYSDIGFCQEESLLTPCITANHQGNEQQITEGGNEEEIMKGKCKIIKYFVQI